MTNQKSLNKTMTEPKKNMNKGGKREKEQVLHCSPSTANVHLTEPKKLEWEMRLENILGNRKDIIDQLVGKIPDEKVIESLKYFDETKRQLDELISSLLTQQRTELLEEILNLECLKEWEVGEKGGNRDEVGIANFVIKQIKDEIKKL